MSKYNQEKRSVTFHRLSIYVLLARIHHTGHHLFRSAMEKQRHKYALETHPGVPCIFAFARETHLTDLFRIVVLRARTARLPFRWSPSVLPLPPFCWPIRRCVCELVASCPSIDTDPVRDPPVFSNAAMSSRQLKKDCFCSPEKSWSRAILPQVLWFIRFTDRSAKEISFNEWFGKWKVIS